MKRKLKAFTLIELLITLALLGAMACLVLARSSANKKKAIEKSMVPYEMKQVKKAFEEFAADCCPCTSDYELMARYGLDVLAAYTPRGDGWSFPGTYNYDRGKGWRGPYLVNENNFYVDAAEGSSGQPLLSSGSGGEQIPVVCDPYYRAGKAPDNYYRVITLGDELLLVFVGPDGVLGDYESGSREDTTDDEADNLELVLAIL